METNPLPKVYPNNKEIMVIRSCLMEGQPAALLFMTALELASTH